MVKTSLNKIIFKWFIILSIIPLSILSIYFYNIFKINMTNQYNDRIKISNILLKEKITSFFDKIETNMRLAIIHPDYNKYNYIIYFSDSLSIHKKMGQLDSILLKDEDPTIIKAYKKTYKDLKKRVVIQSNDSIISFTLISPTFKRKKVIGFKESYTNIKKAFNIKRNTDEFASRIIMINDNIVYSENKEIDKKYLFDNHFKSNSIYKHIYNKFSLSENSIKIINTPNNRYISNYNNKFIIYIILFIIFLFFVIFIISIKITKSISKPIITLSTGIENILDSNYYNIKPANIKFYELKHIWENILQIIDKDLAIRAVAEKVIKGDFTTKIQNYREKDITAISINTMIDYFNEIIEVSNQISKGNYEMTISGEGSLNQAISNMEQQLKQKTEKLGINNWISNGDLHISNFLLQQNDIDELCRKVIVGLSLYTESTNGIFYTYENTKLLLKESVNIKFENIDEILDFNFSDLGDYFDDFKQVIISKKESKLISKKYNIPAIFNKNILLQPLDLNNNFLGVILLAYENEIENKIKILLNTLSLKIAMSLSITFNMIKINGQLHQSKADNFTIISQRDKLNSILVELSEKATQIEREKEKAENANRTKANFIANMSHEIRTPMNSIIGFTELLKDNIIDEESIKYLDSIKLSSSTLLELINDILDMSKLEAKKMKISSEFIQIKIIIENIVLMFEPLTKEKKIDLFFMCERFENHKYLIDDLRIKQILTNLINNAIKFTEKGKVSVILKSKKINDLYKIQIDVVDTGIGINQHQQEIIFESFVQTEGQSTKKYGGTGLGLAISKKLAILMNGDIKISSVKDKGSTFSLILNDVKFLDNQLDEIIEEQSIIQITNNEHKKSLSLNLEQVEDFNDNILIYITQLEEAVDFDIIPELIIKLKEFSNKYNIKEINMLANNLDNIKDEFDISRIEKIIDKIKGMVYEKY